MISEAFLAELDGIKALAVPFDANTPVAGARISLAKGDRVAVILNFGTSTAAVASLVLKQHTAASAGSSKVLAVDNPYYKKINTATAFTKVDISGVPASAYDFSADMAANSGVVILEVLSEQLDNENGYTHFSVDLDDSTAAKLVSGIYVVKNMKYAPAYAIDL